ncbi:MAG TPA: hypothetical protein VGL46_12600 [Pseudonocardiaceae bacterium]|jgi:hypothetical protein
MSITTGYIDLVEALATTGLVACRAGLPGLRGVLLDDRSDHLLLTTSDGDCAIAVHLPAIGAGIGQVLVHHNELAKLLTALVKACRKPELTELVVTINASDPEPPRVDLAGYTVPLTAMPTENMPPLVRTLPEVAHLDREKFVPEASRALPAVSSDEALPMLAGMHLTIADSHSVMAATDRFRIAAGRHAAAADRARTNTARTRYGGAMAIDAGQRAHRGSIRDPLHHRTRWRGLPQCLTAPNRTSRSATPRIDVQVPKLTTWRTGIVTWPERPRPSAISTPRPDAGLLLRTHGYRARSSASRARA